MKLRKKIALDLYVKYKKNIIKEHKLNYLFWECTLKCNLNCKHCGSDCHTNPGVKDMPKNDFLKVVDSITPHVNPNETMIVFTGGEPLMRKDLEQCGKALYDRGFPWGMVTNGYAMTAKRLNALLQAGLQSITVSLDGLEDAHNDMRGKKDSFARALNTIKMLTQVPELTYDVVSCISGYNFHQLEELKQLLIDVGVKKWRIFTVFPIGRAKDDEKLQLSNPQFTQLLEYIKKVRKQGEIKLDYGCEGYLGDYEGEVRDNFFFCRAGINIGSVLVDGSISACPDMRENNIQGNIYKDDFMEVWNNKFDKHRNREWARKGECEHCDSFKYCEGNGMHLRDENDDLLFCHLERIEN